MKVSRNLLAIASLGVVDAAPSGLRVHLLSNTLLACFSVCGSRKADFAARRSLHLGTQSSSAILEVRVRGPEWRIGSSRGRRSHGGSPRRTQVAAPATLCQRQRSTSWGRRGRQAPSGVHRPTGVHHPAGPGRQESISSTTRRPRISYLVLLLLAAIKKKVYSFIIVLCMKSLKFSFATLFHEPW